MTHKGTDSAGTAAKKRAGGFALVPLKPKLLIHKAARAHLMIRMESVE